MARIIALLRGINVGSTRKVPMAELRAVCEKAGLGTVATYIQSGNIVLDGTDTAGIEATLEVLIEKQFGLEVPVVARTAAQWRALADACPFAQEAKDEPKRIVLLVSKLPPADDAVETITARARDGEMIRRCGEALAVYYSQSQADSRLAPALIDRLIGSPATGRNWNTVLKLIEMAAA